MNNHLSFQSSTNSNVNIHSQLIVAFIQFSLFNMYHLYIYVFCFAGIVTGNVIANTFIIQYIIISLLLRLQCYNIYC